MDKKPIIKIDENNLKINGKNLSLPCNYQALVGVFGEPSRTMRTKNGMVIKYISVWDDDGIHIDYTSSQYIWSIDFITKNHPNLALKHNFTGTLFIDNSSINLSTLDIVMCGKFKIVPRIVDDKRYGFKVMHNFEVKEQITENPLKIDTKYNYLQPLWKNWINAMQVIVSEENKYYNLTAGITQSDLEFVKLNNQTNIPEELVNFYKVHNVEYDPVASVFTFVVQGTSFVYDLIPFKKIKTHWQDIQDLCFDDVEDELLDDYDEKVIADNYANPHWIPFAESRDGDYLLYDTSPSEKGIYGQIILLENESWHREVIATSLTELLQNQIELMKNEGTAQYDWIIENG